MTNLVDILDLAGYKYVSDSVKNSAVWPHYVQEAQLFDVKWWLGDGLLSELMAQAGAVPPALTDNNKKLLEGGSYEHGGNTYLFQGLKACVTYYAFARFTSRQPYNYTAAGLTVKDSDMSTPASDKAVQRLSTEAKLQGDALKDEVILYLQRNSVKYPLWCNCGRKARPRTFTAIGD